MGDETRIGYDTVACSYAERFSNELDHKPFDREVLDAFAGRQTGMGTAVDIGCGSEHDLTHRLEPGFGDERVLCNHVHVPEVFLKALLHPNAGRPDAGMNEVDDFGCGENHVGTRELTARLLQHQPTDRSRPIERISCAPRMRSGMATPSGHEFVQGASHAAQASACFSSEA